MSVSSRVPGENLSHWYHLFPSLGISPKDFYAELEKRIAAEGLPQVRTGVIEYSEGGLMSAKRAYLRVSRGDLVFDVCGSPFGSGSFFVSYWLGRLNLGGCLAMFTALLVAIPVVGAFIEKGLRPMTYYQIDSALMFQDSVRGIIMGYVDELAGVAGIPVLTESERKPSIKRLTDL